MHSPSNSFDPHASEVLYLGGPIKLLSNRIFTGCNIYHATSVIRQRVSFGILSGGKSALAGPEFATAFLDRFRGLKTFARQNGVAGDFAARLTSPEGAGFEEILLQAILTVEAAVAFARHDLDHVTYAVIENHAGDVDLIWECAVPKFSRTAAEVALLGVLDLLPRRLYARPRNSLPNFASALEALLQHARRRRLSPATAVLKLAARKRGLPCEAVGRQHLRLGQGKLQQQIYSSMTSTTSIAAQKMCSDKRLTNRRLSELRLPVPQQIKVGSVEAAHAAATKLGFPLVIKPIKGKKGQGVTADLTDRDGIAAAYALAHQAGADVLVERFVPGSDHRLLVIGGKFVAALTRLPPAVVGDGKRTVEALINALNADPDRDGFRLFKVTKDAELARQLARAGVSLGDVLAEGRTLVLRAAANVSTGGLPIDVTEQVHPDNREMAERAARGVGLDIAGIDFLTTDIGRSYREVGGGIVELNARPGLDIHVWPYGGKPRNVAGEVLKLSFPPETDGRIPTVAVAGDKGTGTTARTLDAILRGAGRSVALALRTHSYVNGVSAELSPEQQANAARVLLRDPEVDTLVSTVSPRQAVRRGLVLETFRLTVIMDKVKDNETELFHTGLDIVQRATTDCFVVGAGNVVALDRLRELGARQLILVSERLNDPVLQVHLNAGHAGVATMWQDGEIRIVVLSGADVLTSIRADDGSSRDSRTRKRRLKNGKLFAVAAAVGLGLKGSEIAAALRNAPPIIVPDGD